MEILVSHVEGDVVNNLCFTSCQALAGTRNSSMGLPSVTPGSYFLNVQLFTLKYYILVIKLSNE